MHRAPGLVIYYENKLPLADFSKENSANDADDSTDTIRRYQSSKKHFEEKKSRSSSFISSIDDEQKPLFLGTVDSTPRMVKASRHHGEEAAPPSGRIHTDKRSHSCKGTSISGLSSLWGGKGLLFETMNCTSPGSSNPFYPWNVLKIFRLDIMTQLSA